MDEVQLKTSSEISALLRKALAKANILPENAPTWKAHFRFDSPRLVIERIVRKPRLICSCSARTGIQALPYLFLGTVAGDVLRKSKCDVLVVPPAPSSRLSDEDRSSSGVAGRIEWWWCVSQLR